MEKLSWKGTIVSLPVMLMLLAACRAPVAQEDWPTPAAPPLSTPTAQQGSVVTSVPPSPPVREPAGYLVYTLREVPEGAEPHTELWRTTVSGGERLRLMGMPPNRTFDGVAVAPDGARFAYIMDEDLVGTGELDVPAQLILLNIGDGYSIGSADFRGGSNGSADALLAEGDLRVWPNAFSPDGTRLVFVAHMAAPAPEALLPPPTALWVVDATYGAEPRQVTPEYPSISQPVWLDNDTLIFSPAQIPNVFTQTLLVDISTTPLQPPEALVDGAFVALSPDKTLLLVLREPIGTNIAADQTFPYALVSLAGDTPEIIQEWQLPVGDVAWSPDGTMLAQRDIGGTLRLLDLENGTSEELLRVNPLNESISQLTWSADSRGLIYLFSGTVGGASAPRELYRLNLADRTTHLIVSGTTDDFTEVLVVPPATGAEQ